MHWEDVMTREVRDPDSMISRRTIVQGLAIAAGATAAGASGALGPGGPVAPPATITRPPRRVVRYEHDGTATVLADSYNGKKLNSPNDVVAHPDGSYWFTDPPYGGQLYEGEPDIAGGATNPAGKLNPRIGQPAGFVPGKRELPTNCYRVDPSGRVDLVVTEAQVPDPNGLCFSPDYKKLYVASTGKGPGDTGPGGKGDMFVFDVGTDNKLSNQKRFSG